MHEFVISIGLFAVVVFGSAVPLVQSSLKVQQVTEDVVSAVLALRDEKGQPSIPDGHRVVIDAAAFRGLFDSLGFSRSTALPKELSVKGRRIDVQEWNAIRSCRFVRPVERCTLPSQTTVLRLFSPKWIVANKSLTLSVGLYHRVIGPSGYIGIGGSVLIYEFELREGKWLATKVRTRAVS